MRKKDLRILTMASYRYTTDERIQPLHDEGSNEWVLKISNPTQQDSGIYQCQISTEPKMSLSFQLLIIGKT